MIVQKQDEQSSNLTDNIVKRILTKSPNHIHHQKKVKSHSRFGLAPEIRKSVKV